MPITEKRYTKFKNVVAHRQLDLTVVLENIHDPHNIGAVLRTCDSVGIAEIYVILTDPQIDPDKYKIGRKSSSSSRKWINTKIYTSTADCFKDVKAKYRNIYGTHLNKDAKVLYELDLTESMALVFGNEHDGLSEEAMNYLDGNFIIPQYGMVQSLNISVACAVSLYEASRQRRAKEMYPSKSITSDHDAILEKYLEMHETKYLRGRTSNTQL